MAETITLTDSSAELADLINRVSKDTDGTVFVLDLSGPQPSDGWNEWVVQATERLMVRAGEDARAGRTGHVLTVVRVSGSGAAAPHGWRAGLEQAALEAVRGVVGSLALERVRDGLVANTVIITPETSEHDVELTTRYLLDPGCAGYTIGATLNLTRSGYPSARQADAGRRAGPVLITGAAGTIGFATAEAFSAAGYSVILADLADLPLARRVEQLPGSRSVTLDVTDRDAVRRAIADGKLGDRLAAVVSVHGFQGSARFADLDTDMIETSHAVNGTSVVALIEETLPLLEAHGNGALAVVSSQCGIRAESTTGAYCAPKFGIIGLQRGLSNTLAEHGISFNTLCPGPVDTAFLRVYFERFAEGDQTTDEVVAERAAAMPVGRFARPQEMGEALRYLAQLDATAVLLAPTGGETLT